MKPESYKKTCCDMKKTIYFFLVLIYAPAMVFGQISGDGTYGNPYTGTITTVAQHYTFSGTKYFTFIDVSGGTLTISPGATLLAKTTDSYINITLTGALNAAGTLGNIITFSADNNGNGVSETGETWGNLTFDQSTGTSIVDNALIEHGTGNSAFGLGGGILIYGNNITLRNSTIRNCSINGDGGGIYLYPTDTNVILQNLILHGNSSTGNGGGLVIDGLAAASVTGIDVYSNSAGIGDGIYFLYPGSITNSLIHDHSSGVGVYVPDVVNGASLQNCVIYNNNVGINYSGTGNLVNCDVVNNSTGISSASAVAPIIVNTVLWGNTTQYTISGGSLEFANCGIQGGLSGGTDGGGNRTLSATNGADTGPNFTAPSSNLKINAAISPLVDGGTGSFTGVIIPSTDIEGKPRIGVLDIGAYEFVYFIWSGVTSTDWTVSSNWQGTPSIIPVSIVDNKVVIPSGSPNYPTVTSLSLSSRSVLTIDPRAALTVTGATSVGAGCTFLLRSDATGSANFITGSSVSGSFKVELFISGGGNPDYKWHYVTTPTDGYNKSVYTTDINNPYNLLNYREDLVTINKDAGWNWHDTNGGATPGFSLLQTSRGYNVYTATDQTATFTGTILSGNTFTNSSISCGNGDANQRGWNLIGNPFTSPVDADMITLGGTNLIDKSIYFTQNNHFLSWNTATHVGIGAGVSNIVPALQGFFVHGRAGLGGRVLTIPASSRTYSGNSLYKKALNNKEATATIAFPYLKFNISDGAGFTDDAIIYFFDDATTGFDIDYDAYKLFSPNQIDPQIYSVSDNINLGINGLPIPDKITVVPLNLRIGVAKSYTFNVLNLQNLTDAKVTLIHGTNRIDLKANPNYTFSPPAGTITNMAIEFDLSLTTNVERPSIDQTSCWYSKGVVFIKTGITGFENNSSVIIYDVNGKVVFNKRNISLPSGETISIPVNLENGFYITSVGSGKLKLSKKLVISN
jgi:parallel beta-helix repeat protein